MLSGHIGKSAQTGMRTNIQKIKVGLCQDLAHIIWVGNARQILAACVGNVKNAAFFKTFYIFFPGLIIYGKHLQHKNTKTHQTCGNCA